VRPLALAALVVASSLLAGLRADTPGVYAIRGARLVTAAGPTIESGTIVIRGGVIEGVGAAAAVPAGATVIEGRGLTVYPGLIDLGNTRAAEQPIPQTPQNARTTADLERWKREQILKPQARAADAVRVDDADLLRFAAAGVTSVLALPSGDVVTGQSALVDVVGPPDEPQIGNIVEPRRGLVVVRTPVALHVSFPNRPRAGGNAYPESLMGVIAFVRQAFLDAQHYSSAERAHASTPGDDDPALEAMRPAVEGRLPVAFEANSAREILRALKMAKELKLKALISGGRQAADVAADLKAQNAPVIYSLNYPQRPRTLAPDADEPIATLRTRADAPKAPAALARAGVAFAFESGGADPKEFMANAAKAVRAGLSEDEAIRALTIRSATIANVADRLGSLEKGKIANVVVADGGLFDEKTKITNVFVEGRPVAIDSTTTTPAGRGRGRF
jgi:imidazolonepropionase-like amidohydrolase